MAAAAQLVNPNADVVKKGAAAMMNINAARGLQDVLSSNLGPKGTLKMVRSRGRGSGSDRARGRVQPRARSRQCVPLRIVPLPANSAVGPSLRPPSHAPPHARPPYAALFLRFPVGC